MAAPSEKRALAAMQKVQALDAEGLDALITREIGDPMLGVFSALARAMAPEGRTEEVHRSVHLMVLSWLMRAELERR